LKCAYEHAYIFLIDWLIYWFQFKLSTKSVI
jgi:hypothetical protein